MNSENLQPTRDLRPFPKFSLPTLEGYFSIDRDRQYQDSLANLKYLNIPKRINFNLNAGDDTYVDKPSSADEERISHILTFITKNLNSVKSKKNAPDFVCFRGLLRMLMSTPYEFQEPWIVLATRFKGTIYLCAEETQLQKSEKQRRTERDKKFLRYGFKFESYILSNHPNKTPPGNSKPVIEPEQFCAMFSSEVSGKKILYGAEMDGVIAKEPCTSLESLRKVPMVEVKVKRKETNNRQRTNFYKFKARNWWLQSFLVGIDAIHVGVRNDDGIVEDVKRVTLKELSDEAKRENYWHGTVAMNFLNDFLKKVMKDMKQIDNPHIVFRYQWDPSRSDFVTYNHFEGYRHSFLTQEFIMSMESISLK